MSKTTPGVKIPALDFNVIRLETTESYYEIKVRLKINGRIFSGILEMNE